MKNIKKEKILIATIIIALITIFPTISKAGMQINGGEPWCNITVSESYQECQNLKNSDSTLGSNSLDPHLTLNKDWGAVAYLALSQYGAVTTKTGPRVTVDGISRYTTTGNVTGVLDFGKNHTQTSSFLMGENSTKDTTNLKNNIDTKYVENLSTIDDVANTKGQAFAETKGWYSNWGYYPKTGYPVGVRICVIGYNNNSNYVYNGYCFGAGGAAREFTFRPVIWN